MAGASTNLAFNRDIILNCLGSKLFLYVTALVYVAYRVFGLVVYSYWVDEFYTAHVPRLSWTEVFLEIAADRVHLPGFYLLLKCWQSIVGPNLIFARVLPLLLSLALFFILRRMMGDLKLEAYSQNLCLLLIVSHAVHYSADGRLLAYCPYQMLALGAQK